jgi:class 3 adenylate cyclase/pimeloyl-ACP methyl ester carboxylesterase
MTFDDILQQAIDMLRRRGRVSYRALKRQFDLDEMYLDDLKAEIIRVHQLAVDQDGEMLVWIGDPPSVAPISAPVQSAAPAPLAYTPKHLTEKILASRAALAGERKQVTVLFADLKGSLELLADRDPEEARQILDPVLARMMEAVHRYEGTVNQVLGDGIMALFGAPLALEDHAVRACYAALRMQETVNRWGEEMQRAHGMPVQIRVGLHSGEVVVRSIDSDLHMDYSAIGQTTHLAARMEQMARPGSVLATGETLRLAEGYVQVKALGPVPIKGLQAPIEVFEIVGAGGLRSRLQVAAARGLTRFVGRDVEMEQLQRALSQAQAGHGQAVSVVGEAGVGKSRLFFEFMRSHRTQAWLLLDGNAVSYGKATSYLPVIDLLKGYFQIDDRDPTQRRREKVTGKVLTLDEQLKDTIAPLLFLLDALPEDDALRRLEPPYRRSLVLDALKRLLLRESQRQPLLLVFEDLHWIDTESQTVLDMFVDSLPTSRMLLLTNYRPAYDDRWTTKTYYTRLRIDPLPPQSADELLAAMLGTDASLEPVKTLLKARTAGNPFFLEESVRTLVETGSLVGQPGAYRLARDVQTLQLPATVQTLLAARIDRLPVEEKHILQSAAVIGTDVPLVLLQDLAELSEEALRSGLAHLQGAEFLYETRLFPETEYTFKHALTHNVAYESLLHERRRVLHQRVGQAIEAHYADRLDEYAELLAQQFERGEDRARAGHYYLRTAEKVKEQYAYQKAVELCGRAIELLTPVPTLADEQGHRLVLLGDLHSLLGNVEPANQCYEQALQVVTDTTVRQRIMNKSHRLHHVVRDGGRIACYEHGSGDICLVFLQPVTYSPAMFQPLVEQLCQEFRIITIESRGRGASDPITGPYTFQQHVEDARAVIEALSSGTVVGIGFSRMSCLLVTLAATYPRLVQKLILVAGNATPSLWYSRREDWLEEFRSLLRQGQTERAARLLGSTAYIEPGTEHLVEQWVRSSHSLPADLLLSHFEPAPEEDVVTLLPRIQKPTLVMSGALDRIAPLERGRYLAQHIPGAQLYVFADKGHMMMYTATSEFCEVLRCFVRTGQVPGQ